MTDKYVAARDLRPTSTTFADHPGRNCRTAPTGLFFSAKDTDQAAARAICHGCPVAGDCFTYALSTRERWGVWAGVLFSSDTERRDAVLNLGHTGVKALIHRLWTRGLADRAIADLLNLDNSTVRHHRAGLGLPPVGRPGRPKQEVDA